MDYKDILVSLPKLTTKQLEEVGKRTAALLSVTGRAPEQGDLSLDEDDDYLLAGFIDVIRGMGQGASIPPTSVIRRSYRFRDASQRMRKMIETNIPGMSRTEKRSAGIIVAKSMARWLEGWTTVSLDSMLRNIEKLPEAIEKSFPGYMRSGLLGLMIRTKRKVKG